MTDYKRNLDNNIDDINKKANYSKGNNKDSMQYSMTVYFFNKSFIYLLTAQDTLSSNKASIVQYFVLDQYIKTVFQGIMLDIGVAKDLIAGKSPFKALQFEISKIKLDITYVNKATICFGSGMLLSLISIVQVFTPIGTMNFYIVNIPTSFFLYLKDIDILGIYLNNITNYFICQNNKNISIFCKWRYF